jgi:putative protease
VVRTFRRAIDALASGGKSDAGALRAFTEGQRDTTGAYRKAWR